MAGWLALPIWLVERTLSCITLEWIGIMRKRAFSGKYDRANAAYFRFLGLRRGESDASAIRSAASAMSGLIGDCEGQFGVEGLVARRSEIAVATYRLLDPRRRESFFERVQLTYPADRDEQSTVADTLAAADAPTQNAWVDPETIEPRRPIASPQLMSLPVIERAIQEEASDPATAQAAADTMSWLEERRDVIRSLRDMETRSERSGSPIDWIRSVLGW